MPLEPNASAYDPFERGSFPVGERTVVAEDERRERSFPCEMWYPATANRRDAGACPGAYPLILFSHHSGGNRMASSYLCRHLAGHGYVVAALDHSEISARDLARAEGETPERKSARMASWIESRVPDLRFLLDVVLEGSIWNAEARVDPAAVGAIGHSFGGWTVLAATELEPRIRAVVALAPAGSSKPRPGILPAQLDFAWGRDVPTLYVVAENDVSLPLAGMRELFERTPAAKRMAILSRTDHLHFVDDVERHHEAVRSMELPPELAWLREEMRPISELLSGEEAHLAVRALALAHVDATLKKRDDAARFLDDDMEKALAARGVRCTIVRPE